MVRSAGQPNLAQSNYEDNADPGMSDGAAMMQAGGTIQRTQTAYQSAITVQKPRKRPQVLALCLEEAGLAGEAFFYAWTVKDKNSPTGESLVEGIGIEGAMILARNWGNCNLPISLDTEGPTHWVLKAAFVDFETGFNLERLFRQRKGQTNAKYDDERKLDINFQIGQSKAQRNVVVKALPAWLKDQSIEAAKEAAAGKYTEVAKHIPKFLREFAKLNVDQSRLEKKIGLPVASWEPRDLVTLAAIGRAIKDRQTTVDDEFPANTQTVGRIVNEGEFVTDAEPTGDQVGVRSAPEGAAPIASSSEPGASAAPTQVAATGPASNVDAATPGAAAPAPAPPATSAAAPASSPAAPTSPASTAPAANGGISAAEAAEIAAAERAEADASQPQTRSKRSRQTGED